MTPTSFDPARPGEALLRLQAFAGELVYNPTGRPLTEAELPALLEGCDGALAGLDHYTAAVLDGACCGALRVISRYGVGYDRVDLAAARRRGIAVCNTPGANADAVADLAFGLMLSLARKIPALDRLTKEGAWPRVTGTELGGKTLGLLGLGAIGRGMARRAAGFGMHVVTHDPYVAPEQARALGVEPLPQDELLRRADYVSLHLPLTDETRNLMNERAMSLMKPGAFLVNTARGGLVDERAAYALLKSGHLGGYGQDAFEEEPPPRSPLFELENVVVTPHTGGRTREAAANMAAMAVQNLIDVLSGMPCPNIVNP